MQKAPGHSDPVPSNRPLSAVPSPSRPLRPAAHPDSALQAAVHAAKKKQVYAARKLNHLGRILPSMQQALEAQLSDTGSASSARKLQMTQTLQQIRESRALWQTYEDRLHDLSIKLDKIVGCGGNQQAIAIPRNN